MKLLPKIITFLVVELVVTISFVALGILLADTANFYFILFLIPIKLLLTTVTLSFLYKEIFRPIAEITDAIQAVIKGTVAKSIFVSSKNEIGRLALAVNDMAVQFAISRRRFEQEVRIKTDEFSRKFQELERFNKTMLGRELRMLDLKQELQTLRLRYHEPDPDDVLKNNPELAEKLHVIEQEEITIEDTKRALLNVLEDLEINKVKIEQEKKKAEAILESIGDGMLATDENGKIIFLNSSGEMVLGWSHEDVLGKSVEDVIPFTFDDKLPLQKEDSPIYQALSRGQKIVSQVAKTLYVSRKDKTAFPAAFTVTPVVLEEKVLGKVLDKKILGTITIFRDITQEKEVDRMKTEFISLASHQLRTPLSAVKWFTEILMDEDAGKLTIGQIEIVKNIHQSNQRMIDLVNSLLNISRIESGRIIIEPELTDLQELVNDVIVDLKAKISLKKQNLILSFHDNLPKINIDPKLIRQVYMNLLTNAIKYTPEGKDITVIVSKQSDHIVSQVTDEGYGIPQADQRKVFQKFYRGENIIKVETDGNGLGLYLVKAIIESSQGMIWFKSEEGKGTTFWFSLPLSGMIAKKGEVTLDS